VLIVLDRWLQRPDEPPYPRSLYVALGIVTAVFLAAWYVIGRRATGDVAPVFLGAETAQRLDIALPGVLRAAWLLAWPLNLSADYGPRVIPAYRAFSLAALGGALIVVPVPSGGWRSRRTAPALTFAASAAAAAAVLAGIGDTGAARREYARADSLFDGDPHLDAARALFLVGLSDSASARPLVDRARQRLPFEPVALRAQFVLALRGGDQARAVALADTARGHVPWEAAWYDAQLDERPGH